MLIITLYLLVCTAKSKHFLKILILFKIRYNFPSLFFKSYVLITIVANVQDFSCLFPVHSINSFPCIQIFHCT